MYVLIDTTTHRVLARHASYLALAALHYIQFAYSDAVILGEGTNRAWSQFDANALLDILENANGRPLGPHCYPYNELITHVRAEVERANWLICPFPAEKLVAQANAIAPDCTTPMRFDPESDKPAKVKGKAWRPRRESSYATTFLNQDASLPTSAPPAPATPAAPGAPRSRRSSTPRAPKAPGEPRAPRVPREPGAAPAAGSKTGKVWELADRVQTAQPKLAAKELRAAVIKACLAEGINKSTASVQYGKWKTSKGL